MSEKKEEPTSIRTNRNNIWFCFVWLFREKKPPKLKKYKKQYKFYGTDYRPVNIWFSFSKNSPIFNFGPKHRLFNLWRRACKIIEVIWCTPFFYVQQKWKLSPLHHNQRKWKMWWMNSWTHVENERLIIWCQRKIWKKKKYKLKERFLINGICDEEIRRCVAK